MIIFFVSFSVSLLKDKQTADPPQSSLDTHLLTLSQFVPNLSHLISLIPFPDNLCPPSISIDPPFKTVFPEEPRRKRQTDHRSYFEDHWRYWKWAREKPRSVIFLGLPHSQTVPNDVTKDVNRTKVVDRKQQKIHRKDVSSDGGD